MINIVYEWQKYEYTSGDALRAENPTCGFAARLFASNFNPLLGALRLETVM